MSMDRSDGRTLNKRNENTLGSFQPFFLAAPIDLYPFLRSLSIHRSGPLRSCSKLWMLERIEATATAVGFDLVGIRLIKVYDGVPCHSRCLLINNRSQCQAVKYTIQFLK